MEPPTEQMEEQSTPVVQEHQSDEQKEQEAEIQEEPSSIEQNKIKKATPKNQATPKRGIPKKNSKSDPSSPSIFDKLTDPNQYTGSHKNRFDADGKGRGKEGREDIHKPKAAPKRGTPKRDPSSPSIFDKLTDPNQYTGSHKSRFDADGKGRGKEGREDIHKPKAAPKRGTPKRDPSSPSIFDKLTDPNQYTGSHKNRFDSDGKGRGKEGREDIHKPKAAPKRGSPKRNSSNSSIFDRLTDPNQYTGSHKNRFDADGKGRGKEGREDIHKPKAAPKRAVSAKESEIVDRLTQTKRNN